MDAPPAPGTTRDWSELPADALSVVFAKVSAVDVLAGAGLVCRSWLDAAKMPDLWRSVDMDDAVEFLHRGDQDRDVLVLRAMAKVAVDRSGGRLEVFKGKRFVSDALLEYIVDRSPGLKVISISCFYDDISWLSLEMLAAMARKCPLLEEIDCGGGVVVYPSGLRGHLLHALAGLRQLRRLTLRGIGFDSSKDELMAIVDGCPYLELLDLSCCWFLFHVDDALLAKCARIRTLKLPPSYSDDDDVYCYDEPSVYRDADLFDCYYNSD
ncbi:putative F-box/LRR-repeat protein 23 [Oryza brachyantha]|uniref:F-box domain-containing protein n=1 Tax=Oryza brachyantha TaxID=4533 RepID=J3N9R9_ORYBR|nr:putative F-box/LRR-repeat protein 23 [Oryza brachyantha]